MPPVPMPIAEKEVEIAAMFRSLMNQSDLLLYLFKISAGRKKYKARRRNIPLT